MFERNAQPSLARRPCRHDKFPRPDGIGRSAGEARKYGDIVKPDGEDGIDPAGAENRRQHDGGEDGGKGEGKIRHAHDQLFRPAAPRRRQQAEADPGEQSDRDGDHGNNNGILRPDHQHGDDVAAELVGSQPVIQRWGLEAIGDDDINRARRPEQRDKGAYHEEGGQQTPDNQAAASPAALKEGEKAGITHMSCAFNLGSTTA